MSSSSPIPSIPILSGRGVAVIAGVVALVLLGLSHAVLLGFGMNERRVAEEHINNRVESYAARVGDRLQAIRTRVLSQTESEELHAVLAQSSPAALSRADAALHRLVQPDAMGSPTPFAKAILRNALGEDVAVATAPQDALLSGQTPVPDGPVPSVPLPVPGRRWGLGSTRLPDGVLRLVLAAEVPIEGRAAGQLLLVFTRDLVHFLPALPLCGGELATSALGLRRVGMFARVGDGLEPSQFAELLQAERDCTTAFEAELLSGQTVQLVGRWTVVSGTPLVFAHALAERRLTGRFSLGLTRGSLFVGSAFVFVLSPVTRFLQIIVRLSLRIVGIDVRANEQLTSAAEEIRSTVDLHSMDGNIVKHERDMIGSILDLSDVALDEIMIHRKNMELINADDSSSEIVDQVLGSSYTRLPIYRNDADDIVGVLHAKDVLRAISAHEGDLNDLDIVAVASAPWFVPETTTLREQLNAFRQRRAHFALIVDEYGALMGLVTLEDILEEIVGDISDEHDQHVAGIRKESDGSYIIDGSMTIRDLNRLYDWDLPDEEASTIAGLVVYEAAVIPVPGQRFTFHNFRFEILRRQRNQIIKLRITPPVTTPNETR